MADLIVMSAILSVKACGGPSIPFYAGRLDASTYNPATKLPSSGEEFVVIKGKFTRMGLSMADFVVLTLGAHTIGAARAVT